MTIAEQETRRIATSSSNSSSSSSSNSSNSSSACLSLVLSGLCLAAILLMDCARADTDDNAIRLRAFADRFRETTGEEFFELWHSDCHRRCRRQLLGHVGIACAFDPYKLTKRSLTKRDVNSTAQHIITDVQDSTTVSPFLSKTTAASFFTGTSKGKSVRAHRRKKRGIMFECCHSKSCSWEEYAEYCHTYNRRPTERNTMCYP